MMAPRNQWVPTNLRQILRPYGLTEDEYWLFFEILVSQHSTMNGVFFCPKVYLLGDLKWKADRLEDPFASLVEKGLILYDYHQELLMIHPDLGLNPIGEFRTPNSVKAAVSLLEHMPPSEIFKPLLAYLDTLKKPLLRPLLKKIEVLAKSNGRGR